MIFVYLPHGGVGKECRYSCLDKGKGKVTFVSFM